MNNTRLQRKVFQQNDKYNTVLFSWNYKGFKLLWRYLVKHPTCRDLESLDLEVVDKEMETDEVAQFAAIAPKENAPELTQAVGDEADA